MKKIAFYISTFSALLLISCSEDYKFTLDVAKKTTLNAKVTLTLKEKNNKSVDKVQFFVNGKEVSANGNSATINTNDFGVGKHVVSALAFYPGKTKKINNSFVVYADKKPAIYSYKIINTFPHDTKAYTQGLEYYNGFLYETTGRRGQSSLRKVEIKTGKVLQKVDLDKKYFGEGMTIVNDKIVWLTWENKKGFIYDLKTFKKEGEYKRDVIPDWEDLYSIAKKDNTYSFNDIKNNLKVNTPKVIPISKPKTNWSQYSGWAATVVVGSMLIWSVTQNNSLKEQIATEKEQLEEQIDKASNSLAEAEKLITIFRDKDIISVPLAGQKVSPNSYAKVYWDKKTKSIYLDAKGLPKPTKYRFNAIWWDPLS